MLKLNFQPLAHARCIQNATIPVKEHVLLSVSKGYRDDGCYVGDDNDYEASIMLRPTDNCPYACMVSFKDNPQNNIFSHCGETKLQLLIEKAQKVVFDGEIEILDENEWKHCFFFTMGHDLAEKRKYAYFIWKVDEVRILNAQESIEKWTNNPNSN